MAHRKVKLLCNINKHPLSRVVEREVAAVVWQVVWQLCAAAVLLKKDVNAAWNVAIVSAERPTMDTIFTIRLIGPTLKE